MIDENGKTVQLWHGWLTGAPMRLLRSVPSVPLTHTLHCGYLKLLSQGERS